MVAYGNRQNATMFARANKSNLLRFNGNRAKTSLERHHLQKETASPERDNISRKRQHLQKETTSPERDTESPAM